MKYLYIFFAFVVISILSLSTSFAQEKPEAIIFSNEGCPYCAILKENVENAGLKELLDIRILETASNTEFFYEKVEECELNPNSVGVPMVYRDGVCEFGADKGFALLIQGFDQETLDSVRVSENVEAEEETEKESNSTLFIILGILAILIVVFIVGLFKGKKSTAVNILGVFSILGTYLFLLPKAVGAVCPVCTIAVGAGLGISRYLGIDDIISSLWIGAMTVSSAMWFLSWLDKKGKKTPWISVFTYVGFGALVFLTLYALNYIGLASNTIWGIDRIVFGMVLGGIIFALSYKLHLFLKKKNNDKVYFPYQKIVLTLIFLLIVTAILYFTL
jgi:amino acid transporter